MSSITLAFSGTSSVLRANFFPEIVLDPNADYCCGLLDFTSYNSIPNVVYGQNNEFKFQYTASEEKKKATGPKEYISTVKDKTISFPTGAYEVTDILNYLKSELAAEKIGFSFDVNIASLKVRISFSTNIIWTGGDVLNILGFRKSDPTTTFNRNWNYWSSSIVKITDIDVIRVECDLISGSYINGNRCHTIHQFSHCKVKPGYKFIEVPQHIVYLPIKERRLQTVQISIVDQNGNPINFRGEQISCRIHIKKVNK